MEPKRLHRSRTNRMIAGVCAGLAEYLNVDPTIVRILAVVIPGFGWFGYLVALIIMPEE